MRLYDALHMDVLHFGLAVVQIVVFLAPRNSPLKKKLGLCYLVLRAVLGLWATETWLQFIFLDLSSLAVLLLVPLIWVVDAVLGGITVVAGAFLLFNGVVHFGRNFHVRELLEHPVRFTLSLMQMYSLLWFVAIVRASSGFWLILPLMAGIVGLGSLYVLVLKESQKRSPLAQKPAIVLIPVVALVLFTTVMTVVTPMVAAVQSFLLCFSLPGTLALVVFK